MHFPVGRTLYMCTFYMCVHVHVPVLCIILTDQNKAICRNKVTLINLKCHFLPHFISPSLPPSHSAGLRDAFFEMSFQQMFVDSRRSGRDDLLFYVMYDHNEDKDTIEVMRRDSKTLPRCVCIHVQDKTWLQRKTEKNRNLQAVFCGYKFAVLGGMCTRDSFFLHFGLIILTKWVTETILHVSSKKGILIVSHIHVHVHVHLRRILPKIVHVHVHMYMYMGINTHTWQFIHTIAAWMYLVHVHIHMCCTYVYIWINMVWVQEFAKDMFTVPSTSWGIHVLSPMDPSAGLSPIV